MTTGTIHTVAPDLFLIEGHHPHSLWDDPDLPTIGVYKAGPRLYLLDTGVGPDQKAAILQIASSYSDIEEVVLLNSHGHLDHLGNNDVLSEFRGVRTRHYLPRAARPALDFEAFFGAMYKRGVPYFDYLAGLSLDPDTIASLLRALGADADLAGATVEDLGRQIAAAGISPAIGKFIPSLVIDIVLSTYPPVEPSMETMSDYEDLAEASDITIGDSHWTGWTFGDGEVQALQSAGHSAGGLVFYLPRHKFLMFADETTSVPIWADSDPRNTTATASKALSMMDSGHLDQVCAGHRPMLPLSGDDARAALQQIVGGDRMFTQAVTDALAAHPSGITIDALYDYVVTRAEADSIISLLVRLQFPVFATFVKLTLLNHCLLHGLPEGVDGDGRPTFRLT